MAADPFIDVINNTELAMKQISALIVEITVTPEPTYSIEGQSVSAESYLSTLEERLQSLRATWIILTSPYDPRL